MASALLSWVDADGVEFPLNGESFFTELRGRQGFQAPPVEVVAEEIPGQPGDRVRYIQTKARPVRTIVHVRALDEETLAATRRQFDDMLNIERGEGILRHTAADGVVRELSALCTSGLEGDESGSSRGPGWQDYGLTFRASDPYWYDSSFTTQAFQPSGSLPSFFASPVMPLKLAPSGLFNSFSVDNTGSTEAWPIWTISGPGSSIVLTNTTTGDVLTLTVTLTLGQSIVVDTRPDKKTVVREDGNKHFEYVAPDSALWPLVRGVNAITLAMSGTGAGSMLQIQYKQRYRSN
jgi:phage-related protein